MISARGGVNLLKNPNRAKTIEMLLNAIALWSRRVLFGFIVHCPLSLTQKKVYINKKTMSSKL